MPPTLTAMRGVPPVVSTVTVSSILAVNDSGVTAPWAIDMKHRKTENAIAYVLDIFMARKFHLPVVKQR